MNEKSIYGDCQAGLEEAMETLKDLITAWGDRVKEETGHRPIEHLECRIKTEESMREKLRSQGLELTAQNALRQVYDSVGLRVVCRFLDDVYRAAEAIERMEGVRLFARKDYIRSAKENGYRSYHLIVAVRTQATDVDGQTPGWFFAEVQLRTIAMDTWAVLEHQISYKQGSAGQELIRRELKRCADDLAACDVSMQALRDMITLLERSDTHADPDRRG